MEPPADSVVDKLTCRIAAVEGTVEGATGDGRIDKPLITEVFSRLSDLEEGCREPAPDPRVADLSNRLAEIEQGPTDQGMRADVEELTRRLEVLGEAYSQGQGSGPDPRVEEMAERLASLE